jgi:hypothetical protein
VEEWIDVETTKESVLVICEVSLEVRKEEWRMV